MGEDFFLQILGNNGLAVAGFFYVLFRINPTLQNLTEAINKINADTTLGFKEMTLEINKRLDLLERENHELKRKISELQKT